MSSFQDLKKRVLQKYVHVVVYFSCMFMWLYILAHFAKVSCINSN